MLICQLVMIRDCICRVLWRNSSNWVITRRVKLGLYNFCMHTINYYYKWNLIENWQLLNLQKNYYDYVKYGETKIFVCEYIGKGRGVLVCLLFSIFFFLLERFTRAFYCQPLNCGGLVMSGSQNKFRTRSLGQIFSCFIPKMLFNVSQTQMCVV